METPPLGLSSPSLRRMSSVRGVFFFLPFGGVALPSRASFVAFGNWHLRLPRRVLTKPALPNRKVVTTRAALPILLDFFSSTSCVFPQILSPSSTCHSCCRNMSTRAVPSSCPSGDLQRGIQSSQGHHRPDGSVWGWVFSTDVRYMVVPGDNP